jgi:predicted RNase H-like HicB family nuclease
MSQYSMIIQWSDEDRLFLVTIPEFAELVMKQFIMARK